MKADCFALSLQDSRTRAGASSCMKADCFVALPSLKFIQALAKFCKGAFLPGFLFNPLTEEGTTCIFIMHRLKAPNVLLQCLGFRPEHLNSCVFLTAADS